MNTHTPGPWETESVDATTWRVYSEDHGGIAMLAQADYDPRNPEHDARLIAAAPDLLAVAVEWLTLMHPERDGEPSDAEYMAHYDRMRAAVAKAGL